ncbi:hypothetical protein BKA62DRAFT_704330 [Auriculariales sp. MPI-PUGE-AT-0066]|nr:hypothetical protein BKA62DRAFT_704330 [Auriculariales sp. MPI-PUGE-AT-0066]
MSHLWTYLGFPISDDKLYTHLPRLHALVVRSQQAPVDIVFLWGRRNDISPTEVPRNYPISVEILDSLKDLAPRWRHVTLNIAQPFGQMLADTLRGNFPFLESLSLEFEGGDMEFPRAPRLTRVYLAGNKFCPFTAQHCTPCLSKLAVCGFNSDRLALNAEGWRGSPAVMHFEGIGERPHDPLVFSHLRVLVLEEPTYLRLIRAPSLRALTLNTTRLREIQDLTLTQFVCIQHLALYGRVDRTAIPALAQFYNITQLSFEVTRYVQRTWPPRSFWHNTGWDTSSATDRNVQVMSGTLSAMAKHSPLIWPLLERICFGYMGVRTNWPFIPLQELIDFITLRNGQARVTDVKAIDGSPPSRLAKIREIVVEKMYPISLASQLRMMSCKTAQIQDSVLAL